MPARRTKNPIPACKGPGSARPAGRGEAVLLGAEPCSKQAFKGSMWDAAGYALEGTQFEPVLGYPGPDSLKGTLKP